MEGEKRSGLPLHRAVVPGSREQKARSDRVTTSWLTLFGVSLSLFLFARVSGVSLIRSPSLRSCPRSFSDIHRYPGERLEWVACGAVAGTPVECSNVTVPMDQFNATNSGNDTFLIPLIRMRGANATQNLLLNPGGPGGSGSEFLHRRGEQLRTIVGDGYHLLSFDPRGINGSKPRAECYPDAETRRALSPHREGKLFEDSPEMYAFATNLVKSCADTMGKHGRYINTPQTAADMNSIIEAVGQKNMLYWGFSYGTLLGQTYATMYPERAHRVIIDGVVNQFDWYNELVSTEDLSDTKHVLEGFFKECVKAGPNCTLSGIADSADKLWDEVLDLAQSVREEPLSVYVNNTAFGLIDYNNIMYDAIFPALYKPANWYGLAESLARLLRGNGSDAYLKYGRGNPFELNDDSNTFVTMNDQKAGPRYWPQGRQSLLDITLPAANASLFGPVWQSENYIKQKWAITKTHNYVPKQNVETLHPLLILSTTYDPVCPLVSAKSAQAAFVGSRIVEVKGYGHCSVAVPSVCLAKHVRAFLYNGTLPDSYTQCEADGPYFIKPSENSDVLVARKHFDDPGDAMLHRAQLELAQDPSWPYRRR